ncbi:ABC transporter ATP-binding protein [bacterium]|nr:ABC transporter ATP-binding protein [bacterium]
MPLIQLSNVTKEYALGETQVSALRGVDFSVDQGDFLSIIGPSGSGKTTLLNIIGCIDTASSGSVMISGKEITQMSDAERTDLRLYKIGFIFQTFNLIAVLDVLENIEFPLLLMNKYSKEEVRKRAQELADAVGLTQYTHHRPSELSGGQRQRVAIARALVSNPDIVLADEPTANLDSQTGATILELMKHLNTTQKTTFIFSTHDAEVLQYARRIVKIKDGRIVES